jgi:tetratricopeptide (TPR) repeat protein
MRTAGKSIRGACFSIYIFIFSNTCLGQYENLINKTYAQRSPLLFDFYINGLRNDELDSVAVFQKINAIALAAGKAGDEDLLSETGLMRVHYYYYRAYFPRPFVLRALDSIGQIAQKSDRKWLLARVKSLSALTCSDDGYNYELGFIYFREMDEIVRQLSIMEFPEKQICYYQMGYAYYLFSEWENAIRYFTAGLKEIPPPGNFRFNIQIHNTLGLCYQKLNQFDSSGYHFRKALEWAKTEGTSFIIWEGILFRKPGIR